MSTVECPVCGATIELKEDVKSGDVVQCSECGTKFVVQKRGRRIRLKEVEEEEYLEEE